MTGIVLQARLDSSRLPGKALLPLGEKPILFRVMQALNHVTADARILACSEDSFDAFKPLAQEAGFEIISGSKDDVLGRFCKVIRHFSLKRVIRATGDNPFVFADTANAINEEAAALNADYAGYSGLPYGAGVESIKAEALLRAEKEASERHEREHVCPYLYNHAELFTLHRPLAPLDWQRPDIRITVDTQEDYEKAKKLYTELQNEEDLYCGSIIIKTYDKF